VPIQRVITSGIFSLDGEGFEVDNNIWLVGDDREVIIVDAAHDHRPILEGVGGRSVKAIVCTHAHNDHINAAAALADETGAPIWLHPDDTMLWEVVYPDRRVDDHLRDGQQLEIGGSTITMLHTPGHSPGGIMLFEGASGILFSGDTVYDGPLIDDAYHSDIATYVATMKRILDLPVRLVHGGHFPSFDGERYRALIRQYLTEKGA